MTSYISPQAGSPAPEPTVITLAPEPNILHSCINQSGKIRKKKPYALSNLQDLKIQQGLIIKDLLFSLLGFEGSYIRYSERYDASEVDFRIKGPDFKIAKHLDVSLKIITKSLVRYGKYYSGLVGFLEYYDQPDHGKIVQKLCYVITNFLQKYQQVIIEMEQQYKFNAKFNLSALENSLNQEIGTELAHLYDLIISIHDETMQRQALTNQEKNELYVLNFFQNIQNDLQQTGSIDFSTDNSKFNVCKGGLVLQIVQSKIISYKGDPVSLSFLTSLFDSISADYVEMLNQWLMNGEIDDPFEEFLIKQNKLPDSLSQIFHSSMEKYWDELYMTKSDGLIDQFKSKEIQFKILSTGKLLNIFKTCTGLDNFENLNENLNPIHSLYAQDFELKISKFYERANRLFLKLAFEGYNFNQLIDHLETTYLFKESSRIDSFLDRSFNDLKRNKHTVSSSRLIKSYNDIFHAGLNEFNVILLDDNEPQDNYQGNVFSGYESFSIEPINFFDTAKEIINVTTFDVEEELKGGATLKTLKSLINKAIGERELNLAQESSNSDQAMYDPDHFDDYAMNAVNLELKLPFPLNLIITENYTFEYQLIFKFQVIIKFISKLLDTTWKEISYSTVWKYSKFSNKIKKWALRCRILHNRMKDLMNEIQSYINYEIIDHNSNNLKRYLVGIENNLHKRKLGSSESPPPPTGTQSIFGNSGISHHKSASLNITNNQNNNIFDQKIFAQSTRHVNGNDINGRSRHPANGNQTNSNQNTQDQIIEESDIDVYRLSYKIGSFLNNLLRDSLITNRVLIDSVKNLFDVIILYNNHLQRFRKPIILINVELFEQFSQVYPDKFANKSMDEDAINKRFDNLNQLLNAHFELFNLALTEFIVNLKSHGELENQLFSILIERLERCFPDRQ